jgi:hypothetical protein
VQNVDIYNALVNNVPVFYGDADHAMLVVQAIFIPTPYGPYPVQVLVADPDPAAPDCHLLNMQQMQGMYAAISTIQP